MIADAITSIHTEVVQKDSLIEFLDNNPPEATKEAPILTQKEQELVWQADWDAEQRRQNQLNTSHL